MTRLRLAPSSPERIAGLIKRLHGRHGGASAYWTHQSEYVQGATRGTRLLLRWYAWGHVHGNACCNACYRDDWCAQFGTDNEPDYGWPTDGDRRLRRELGE